MYRNRWRRGAFTLVELLVVIAIIGMLFAILLPAMSKARSQARNVVCLSNVRQLAQAFRIYAQENHNKPPGGLSDGILSFDVWLHQSLPRYGPLPVLCPEAMDVGTPIPNNNNTINDYAGSARLAWGVDYIPGGILISAPWWGLRTSSYGINWWVCSWNLGNMSRDQWNSYAITDSTKGADRVPVIADAVGTIAMPRRDDTPPSNLINPDWLVNGSVIGMRVFCISRHNRAINIAFLDGHASTTPLKELWKLRWSRQFVSSEVVLPPG